jgi:hypothetical protein
LLIAGGGFGYPVAGVVMKKKRPPWHRVRRKEERAEQRELYIYQHCPQWRPLSEGQKYWELGHDYDFAVRAPAPDQGDLPELLKLQLARAFQCEQAIRDKLKSFRLDG